MARILAQSLNVFVYPIDSRPFRAHMSIGLVRHNGTEKVALSQIKPIEIPAVMINQVDVIKSKLSQGKATYVPLAQFRLTR